MNILKLHCKMWCGSYNHLRLQMLLLRMGPQRIFIYFLHNSPPRKESIAIKTTKEYDLLWQVPYNEE